MRSSEFDQSIKRLGCVRDRQTSERLINDVRVHWGFVSGGTGQRFCRQCSSRLQRDQWTHLKGNSTPNLTETSNHEKEGDYTAHTRTKRGDENVKNPPFSEGSAVVKNQSCNVKNWHRRPFLTGDK